MEPTSNLQNTQSQQTPKIEEQSPTPWQTFMKDFSPDHQKIFLRNMSQHFSQMIARNMRKMKETLRKMREES